MTNKKQTTQTTNQRFKKLTILKYAAAAIFIAVLLGLHQFNSLMSGTSIVWADVEKKLEKIHSFKASSHRIFSQKGENGKTNVLDGFHYYLPEKGIMEEQYIDGELCMQLYALFSEETLVVVLPQMKQYYRFKLNQELLSLITYMNPINTDGIIKDFGSERCEKLGKKDINGVAAEGFEIKDLQVLSSVPKILFQLQGVNITMWINTETLLPIVIEGEGLLKKGVLTGFKDVIAKQTLYNPEYDAEIDESIFEPNIPDDYTLIDPNSITEKAEMVMIGMIPCGLVAAIFKRVRKKKTG